ncbi:tetratricopeptide repeat protein [Streptomyces agglomeratus]|uniref:tetratricopeptide repeat protein n=1 Tax=Streptomyces agglomeratus TaxID=285458 RepID=UPI00114D13B3|nr:tetratricopeptide repeat protein [Streptomyces agglomeratus]
MATGIGAAVTTVYTLVADRMRPQHVEPNVAALLRTASGGIPRVDQLDRPELAGVHPADGHHDQRPAPPYVERDAEPSLRQALEQGGFVLIVGESTAGKTRLAYEVARSCFPRHAFVRPMARTALAPAIEVARRRRRAVLWLDDLENYLGSDGVTTSMLAGLLQGKPGRVVVLATMRSEEYRRYDAREESRLTGSDRDAWRIQRQVLHLAVKIRLERHWSMTERQRAVAHQGDPRIRLALESCDRFGLAEVVAAGPELLAAWENAWAPGANPRGAAIVAAAVDCRRSGLRRSASRQWLQDLHLPYLAERGGPDLQPEPFAEAMQWACKAAYATSGLLIGNYSQGYIAFDYLLNAPELPPVPDHLWETLLSWVEPADAYDMGLLAHQASQLSRATAALERARAGGAVGADFLLAIAVGDRGWPRQAVGELEGIVRRRQAELGPCHPDTLVARHQWAFFTGEADDPQAASTAFGALVVDAAAALGPEHTDTLAARHQQAYFTGEAGETCTAIRQLRDLLDDRLRLEGPDHPQVLSVRRSLIWFSSLHGDLAEAERQLQHLLTDAQRSLGPDDPHMLAIRSTHAAFAARAGRTSEATAAFAQLVTDRSRVLGHEHPHAIHTRLQKAQALVAAGHSEEASEELTQTLNDAQHVLEPGHRHTVLARSMLDRLQRP